MNRDSLGDRMKSYYEDRSKTYLPRRSNVIIRIDGCHFHTYTKYLEKPFDEHFISAMQYTALNLCKNIQGCKLAYVQSDEISLLLTDYDKIETDAWFDNSVQKMCSVAASMATLYFNESMKVSYETCLNNIGAVLEEYIESLKDCIETGAYFDARCFVIPKEEVCNYFIWRQQDAIRNSISGLAQAYFTQKELNGKSTIAMKEMLSQQYQIKWEELETEKRCGACIKRSLTSRCWEVDHYIPSFVKARNYIEDILPE